MKKYIPTIAAIGLSTAWAFAVPSISPAIAQSSLLDQFAANLHWPWTSFGWRDRPATWPAKITVAEVRPNADNHTIGLDVSPGPNAVEHPDNGYSWIDVMNHSTQEPEGAPSFSARVGTKDKVVEFGSRSWNGAGVRAVHIILDRKVAMRLELDSNGNPIVTTYGELRAKNFVTIPANAVPPT